MACVVGKGMYYCGRSFVRDVLGWEGLAVVVTKGCLWAEWRCEDGDCVIVVKFVTVISQQLLVQATRTLEAHPLQTIAKQQSHSAQYNLG